MLSGLPWEHSCKLRTEGQFLKWSSSIGMFQGCFCTELIVFELLSALRTNLLLNEVCYQVVFTMGAPLPRNGGDFYEIYRAFWLFYPFMLYVRGP